MSDNINDRLEALRQGLRPDAEQQQSGAGSADSPDLAPLADIPNETRRRAVSEQEDEVTRAASRLQRLHIQRKEIDDEMAEIKSWLLDQKFPEGTVLYDEHGRNAAKVRRSGRRFDEVKATQVLPAATLALISVMKPDAKVAKAKLPPAAYDELLTDGAITVVLSR